MITYILIGIMMSIVDWMIYGSIFDNPLWKNFENSVFKGYFKCFYIIGPIIIFIEEILLWPLWIVSVIITSIMNLFLRRTTEKAYEKAANLVINLTNAAEKIVDEVNEEDDLM